MLPLRTPDPRIGGAREYCLILLKKFIGCAIMFLFVLLVSPPLGPEINLEEALLGGIPNYYNPELLIATAFEGPARRFID